jgi:hypothetical protein
MRNERVADVGQRMNSITFSNGRHCYPRARVWHLTVPRSDSWTAMSLKSVINCSNMDVDDEILAAQTHLPLLISAPSSDSMIDVARRVHAATFNARAPLVAFHAASFFNQRVPFASQWAGLMDAGRGGSIFITAIEEMPSAAQLLFTESLSALRETRPTHAPRLMAGTTVSLLDRVTSGEFSEELFYRLNMIHLLVRDRTFLPFPP